MYTHLPQYIHMYMCADDLLVHLGVYQSVMRLVREELYGMYCTAVLRDWGHEGNLTTCTLSIQLPYTVGSTLVVVGVEAPPSPSHGVLSLVV